MFNCSLFLLPPDPQLPGMHTTVKKFLNSLVPPFVDPAYVPKDVDKNWSCYKHARPQRAT